MRIHTAFLFADWPGGLRNFPRGLRLNTAEEVFLFADWPGGLRNVRRGTRPVLPHQFLFADWPGGLRNNGQNFLIATSVVFLFADWPGGLRNFLLVLVPLGLASFYSLIGRGACGTQPAEAVEARPRRVSIR